MSLTALAAETAAVLGGTVDARPTWDLIHGMCAAGYPLAWVEERVGTVGRRRVTPELAAAVARLADWCAVNPGPSELARQLARASGWTVDLLWADAEDWDDPGHVDEQAVRRALDRALAGRAGRRELPKTPLGPGEERALVAAMLALGHAPPGISDRTGISCGRVYRLAREVRGEGAP